MKKVLILFTILYCIVPAIKAQNTIEIFDRKTNEPIRFANVCFEGIAQKYTHFEITDDNGKMENHISVKSKIAVSFIGYKALIDTVLPNKSYKFFLEPTVFDIDEVVVTAQFNPERVDNSIYKVKVLNSKQIERQAATNVAELLKNELNMRSTYDGVFGSGLTIQGLSGNNIKILIDGVPVIGRVGGNIDLNQLNLQNVDHIEVVEGSASVIYGNNALAGAINIITKENKFNSLTGGVNAYYETVGIYNFDGAFSMKRNRHSFSVNLGRQFFGGFRMNDTLRSFTWEPKEQYTADLHYIYSDAANKLKISTSAMRELLIDKGNLLYPYYETALDNYFYTYRITNKIQYQRRLSFDKNISTDVAYSYYDRIKNRYTNDLTKLEKTLSQNFADHDTTSFRSLLFRSVFSRSNENCALNLQTGVDVNYEKGGGKRILDNEQDILDAAVFASAQYKPFSSLVLQPGVRLSYNSDYKAPLVPSINVKWNPYDKLNIRASYTRGFRAPSIKELYIHFVDINHDIYPNTQLSAEYGHNFSLSMNFNTENVSKTHFSDIETSVFYNNMFNIITLARVGNPADLMYQYVNIAYFKTFGGRLNFRYRFHPYMNFSIGLGETGINPSFEKSTQGFANYRFTPDVSASYEYFVPRFKGSLSLFYKYQGKAHTFDIDEEENILLGSLADYHNIDITLVRNFFNDTFIASAGVKNLFDNKTIETQGAVSSGGGTHTGASGSATVAYGRTFFLKFSYNIR